MIASVRGLVRHVGLDHVVVEVGGVGLLVHTTPATAAECRTGTEVTLETTLVVREESLTLYGFAAEDDDLHPAEAVVRRLFVMPQLKARPGIEVALHGFFVEEAVDARDAIVLIALPLPLVDDGLSIFQGLALIFGKDVQKADNDAAVVVEDHGLFVIQAAAESAGEENDA